MRSHPLLFALLSTVLADAMPAQKPGAKGATKAAAKAATAKDATAKDAANAQDNAARRTASAAAQAGTSASNANDPIAIGHKRFLRSKILGEKRELWISTPRGYDKSKQSYPVLYLLDGPAHFTHTVGTTGFLARNGRMPEVIVVGINNTDRTRDLTPTRDASIKFPGMRNAGGADRFLNFVSDELAPYLAKNYRTNDYRILVGHSFGGLFALHALTTKPGFFQAMVAISPSLQWNKQALLARAKALLADETKRKSLAGDVYITVGNERGGLLGGVHKFSGLLTEKAPKSLRWKFAHMPSETHGSVPHRSTYDGLEFVFKKWTLEDAKQTFAAGGWPAIEAYYAGWSKKFGSKVNVPQGTVRDVMMGLIEAKRLQDALALGNKLAVRQDAKRLVPGGFWRFLAMQFEEQKDKAGVAATMRGWLKVAPENAIARKRLAALTAEASKPAKK